MVEYVGTKKLTIGRIALYFVVYILAILWMIPLIWMIITSLKPQGSPVTDVAEWFKLPYTFENYVYVFENAPILRWTFNSAFVAIVVTAFSLLFASLAAFALSKINFRYKDVAFWLILSGMMVPGEAVIIPLYMEINSMNLLNSYWALILPSLAGPLGVLVLKEFFDGIPNELMEAATIDGCSMFGIWWRIFLPLSKASLSSLAIFTFLGSWNNFLWPFLSITSDKIMTLPVGLPNFMSSYSQDYVRPMAANAFASLPVIIVFLFFQKNIIKGITLSGLKG
ncbi:carbohydrate ABC transporter permease [Caldanaerobius polysaccharolyticus]|uniref:carbohydrate ABC transporter permease n=1 Tax=Caldanaerobius polysaccharolyticus TaxID=44256 RepID=UPI00068A6E59|nr:carbohydrate ABC transporter permease [Caldanaerobius polysaccharolyticus]